MKNLNLYNNKYKIQKNKKKTLKNNNNNQKKKIKQGRMKMKKFKVNYSNLNKN